MKAAPLKSVVKWNSLQRCDGTQSIVLRSEFYDELSLTLHRLEFPCQGVSRLQVGTVSEKGHAVVDSDGANGRGISDLSKNFPPLSGKVRRSNTPSSLDIEGQEATVASIMDFNKPTPHPSPCFSCVADQAYHACQRRHQCEYRLA